MIDNPLRCLVEQRRAGMDKDLLVVTDGFVAFSRIFATRMIEEACANGLSDLGVVLELLRTA